MKSLHFEETLLPTIIDPVIEDVYNHIEKEFKEKTELRNKRDEHAEQYIKKLCFVYEQKRDWLRDVYWGSKSKYSKNEYVDMHKIAAVLCKALVLVKPFQFNLEKAEEEKEKHGCNYQELSDDSMKWLVNNYLCNYKVAVDVALLITFYDFIDKLHDSYKEKSIEELKESNYKDILLDLTKKRRLDCYEPSFFIQSHAPFYDSLIYDVAMNDINNRDFDYLGFANICFQLQQYNIMKILFKYCKANKLNY